MRDKEKMVKVTKAKGFERSIPESEYIEDNLLFHSMVHNLDVVTGQIDILREKGYLFQMLKKKANDFHSEAYGHISNQFRHMEMVGNMPFYNKTQSDYDFISDFLKRANPAKITYLAEMIRKNSEIHNMNDEKLRELLEKGEIYVEPTRIGKSELNGDTDQA